MNIIIKYCKNVLKKYVGLCLWMAPTYNPSIQQSEAGQLLLDHREFEVSLNDVVKLCLHAHTKVRVSKSWELGNVLIVPDTGKHHNHLFQFTGKNLQRGMQNKICYVIIHLTRNAKGPWQNRKLLDEWQRSYQTRQERGPQSTQVGLYTKDMNNSVIDSRKVRQEKFCDTGCVTFRKFVFFFFILIFIGTFLHYIIITHIVVAHVHKVFFFFILILSFT